MDRESTQATLSRQEVNRFWKHESSSLAALLQALDPRESWPVDRDGEIVDIELNDMGDPSEYLSPQVLDRFDLQEMSEMLSLLSFSRSMRLQRIFNDIKPEWLQDFSSVIEEARHRPDGNINYSRLRLLAQFSFLGAVFSPARFDMITESLFEVIDEY